MPEVELNVVNGPRSGQTVTLDLRRPVVIGRSPGAGGVVLPGDLQVGRRHGEISLDGGRPVYRNLHPNGTLVNGRPESGRRVLEPGDRLGFGSGHLLEVIRVGEAGLAAAAADPVEEGRGSRLRGLLSSGPLARPLVRVLLAVYLVGFLLLAGWLAGTEEGGLAGWEEARESYRTEFAAEELPEGEAAERLARADQIVRELTAYERTGRWAAARAACRELMALDGDPDSPLYRFGARRLGRLEARPGGGP